MKTRIIHTRFWEDEKVAGFSREAKLLFIYLFTNSRMNMIGIYELADRIISFETGLNKEELIKAKEELQEAQRMVFYKNWIYVVNAIKYCDFKGPTHQAPKAKEINNIPKEIREFYETIGCEIPHAYPIASFKTNKKEIENNNLNEEVNLDDIQF